MARAQPRTGSTRRQCLRYTGKGKHSANTREAQGTRQSLRYAGRGSTRQRQSLRYAGRGSARQRQSLRCEGRDSTRHRQCPCREGRGNTGQRQWPLQTGSWQLSARRQTARSHVIHRDTNREPAGLAVDRPHQRVAVGPGPAPHLRRLVPADPRPALRQLVARAEPQRDPVLVDQPPRRTEVAEEDLVVWGRTMQGESGVVSEWHVSACTHCIVYSVSNVTIA